MRQFGRDTCPEARTGGLELMIKILSETSLHNVLREAGVLGYRHRDI